jgi:hypothetical protein
MKQFIEVHSVYVIFWLTFGMSFLVALFFCIKWAIIAAAQDLGQ